MHSARRSQYVASQFADLQGAAARLRDHRGTGTFAPSPAGTCRRCVVWERSPANPDAR
jgi:hypothetical protein